MRLIRSLCVCLCFFILSPTAHASGFIRDAEIEQLLADYSLPLFRAAGLNPDTVGIALINNKTLNAFVANGQNIYFHTGLILEAEDPNMVIGVIAHEIGHIIGGHLSRKAGAINEAQRPAVLATILGLGSLLAGSPDVGLALITGGQQVAERKFLSFNRAQESSADVIALRLLQDTAQSPNGIIRMMDMLADQEILSEVSQDPYIRSHPLSRERVANFTRGAEISPHRNAIDDPELLYRHEMAQAKIRGFLDHPSTTLRRYPAKNTDMPSRYARAIALHRQGRVDGALNEIDALIAEAPNSPWFHELRGQMNYEAGRARDGLASYKKAVELAPDQPLLLIGLATTQLSIAADAGDMSQKINREAESNLRKALRLDPNNTTAYFQLSKAFGQMERVAYAEWALAEYYALLNRPEALKHAGRAVKGLPVGSPEKIRTTDILEISRATRARR
ncbi:MAG: hypothetical protein CBD03_03320 [Rhizobiales bacterium TMED143]|nr:hypothetical protein [Rhodobiaceae bacterium]OUV92404.1 MAG: hypothetical protein CBD03_03320 [Rhizobiales bacterium TMED143]HCQ82419.1 hypothetical protein [Rhodobiaceae bacterium]|tara:strand:+ start:1156 stop:2502 length:1347 start_codon:yes stop_codon:yes gene_type:complete